MPSRLKLLDAKTQDAISKQKTQIYVLWAAMNSAILIYTYLGLAVTPDPFSPGAIFDFGELIFLAPLAILLAAASFFVPKLFKKRIHALLNKPLSEVLPGDPNASPLLGGFEEKDQRLILLSSVYTMSCIIRWGIGDAIGIFGFLIAVRQGSISPLVPFAVLAFLLVLFHRPALETFLEEQLKNLNTTDT